MKNKFHILNFITFVLAMVTLVYYDSHRHMLLKGFTSSWFVLLGFINLIYAYKNQIKDKSILIYICIGLFVGMCADVFLWMSFIVGTIFFALGHVFYLIAFFKIEKFHMTDLYASIPIAIVSIILVFMSGFIEINDITITILLILYTFILSTILGKAFMNYKRNQCLSRLILLVGCFLFMFSDLMLAFDMFGNAPHIIGELCVYSYWPAQNIIAYSLYHYVNERKVVQ